MSWKQCTIADLGEVVTGKTPSTKNAEFWGGRIPFITPKDIQGLKRIIKTERTLTDYGLQNVKGAILPQNAVCVSCIGNIGYTGITTRPCVTNQQINSIITNNDNDPDFVYYLMRSLWPFFKSYEGQSTTLSILNKTQFSKISVCVPDLHTQKQIANVLSSLDAKIETNVHTNNNLQQQAQTLFNAWFVDFYPFGGVMPSDWVIGCFMDIIDFSNGYAFKSKELFNTPQPDSYKVFKQGHILRGGGFNPEGTKSWFPRSKALGLQKFVLRKGDVLMAMTDMKDNVQILGNTAIMEVDDQYIVNQRVGVLRCKEETGVTFPYVFLLTNSNEFLHDLRSRANSGVQVNLSSTEIKNSPLYIAPPQIYSEFSEIVMPMFESIISNDIQNQQLAALRDSLLPKLMSGEIDVSDIQL